MTSDRTLTPPPEAAAPPGGRQTWIDAVRGFAVFLVVLYHSVIAMPVTGATTPGVIDAINDALAPLRMPVLVFLSGLLLHRSLRRSPGTYLRGKLSAIGWPWVVWTTITVLFLYWGSRTAGDGEFGVERALRFVVDPRTYTWYLAYLLTYYILALLIRGSARTVAVPVLFVIAAVTPSLPGEIDRWAYLFAFFLLGDLAARHASTVRVWIDRPVVRAVAVAVAVAFLVVAGAGVPMRYQVWSVPGVAACLIILACVAPAIDRSTQVFSKIGRESIVYYLTHWPVVAAAAHLLHRAQIHNGTAAVLILIAAGLGVSFVAALARRRSRVVSFLYAWPRRTSDRFTTR